MNEHKVLEMNLKNNEIKIKEELPSFENDFENENILEIEISPTALSYGQVFILESEDEDPFTWWISCNICREKFTCFDNFLNHAINIHLNKKPNKILKAEHENFYNEFSHNNNDNINKVISDSADADTRSLDGNECDLNLKLEQYDIPDSDLDNIDIESENENKDFKNFDKIDSEKGNQKKELLPRHCEKCNKTFKKPSTLRRHLNVHFKKDNKMYECKICHEKFSKEQKRLYRNHRDRAHREKIPCTLCEKTFGSKFYLDVHMKTHTGAKDFKCNECPAAFYSKTSLSGHIRKTHLTPKVPCRFCSKFFRPGSCLEIHERIHTGEKPFVCEQCGTAFQTNSLLQNHIMRHNNDRRFECDICGKKFFNHTYLRDHKVTHTDAKPYGCDICMARFNSGPALRKHKNLHSGVKKYQCKICGKSYAQSPGLYAHMKSHNIAEDKSLFIKSELKNS